MRRHLRYFPAPLALALASAVALTFGRFFPRYDGASPLYALAEAAPVLLLALCGLLGWKLNQTRILFHCAYLTAIYALLGWRTAIPGIDAPLIDEITIAAVTLPLALALGWMLREARLASAVSALRVMLVLLPAAALLLLAQEAPEWFSRLRTGADVVGGRVAGWRLPPGAVALAVLPLLISLLSRDFATRIFAGMFTVAEIPFLYGLNELAGGKVAALPTRAAFTLSWTVGATILLYGIFRVYWERVYIDELTEIPNRRALNERLRALGRRYSIAMVDIDHFKKFNDRFGHEEGDNVLRFVASHLQAESGSRAYRYGGEEFCLVFPGVSADDAAQILDRARRKLEAREFFIRSPETVRSSTGTRGRGRASGNEQAQCVKITVSSGVAEREKGRGAPDLVIKAADHALYAAKRGGRNRVVIA